MPPISNADLNDSAYRMIFVRSRDPLFIIDATTGYHQNANPAAITALGYSLDELRQVTALDLLDAESRTRVAGYLSGQAMPESETFQLAMRRSDGTLFPVEWGVVPFSGADGPRMLIHVRDITERLQTEDDLRWMVHKVETLKKIGALVTARGGLQKTLHDVLHFSCDELALEAGGVFLIEPGDGITLRMAVGHGLPDSLADAISALPVEATESVMGAGCATTYDLSDQPTGQFKKVLHEHGFAYLVAAPILAHDGAVGLFALVTSGDTRLSERQLTLFGRIGNEIGEAVVHQQLHQQTRRQLDLMHTFQSLSRQISLGREPDETFALIGEETMRAMGADRIGIYLVNPNTDRVRKAWAFGLSQTYVDTVDALYEQIPDSQAIAFREPRLIANALTDPAMAPIREAVRAEGYHSVGLYPMVSQDQAIGAVGYYFDTPHTFRKEEVEIAQTFANELATFLQNYRLLARLREAESWQRLTLQATSEAVLTADANGTIVDVNQAACKMFGYEQHELIGKPIAALMGEEDREAHTAAFDRFVKERRERRQSPIPGTGLRSDGSTFPLENSVGSFLIGDDRFVTAYIRDRSDVAQLEARLRQSQKMEAVGTLAGGVAHDFNNILTGVIGYVELGMMRLPTTHPVRAHLEKVKDLGERAATLTRQLLAFSRRQVLDVKPLDLNAVVAELAKFLRRVIGEDVALRLIPGEALWTVHADRAALEQILMNLCLNARDAMPDGGELLIETTNVVLDEEYQRARPWALPGRYTMLMVSDTGAGMDEETMEHIFEPFFTTKEVGKGSGLGLAMVYGLVKQHNGLIHVYSEVGKGTTFKVYLPALIGPAEMEPTATVQDMTVPSGKETILVVEDEDVLQDLLSMALKEQGYQVLLASNGEEALRIWEQERASIDLIIADVVMPVMGGRELYDRVQERGPDTRFLFISGYSVNGIHQRFLLEQELEFLQKPFTPVQLLKRVQAVLENE